jgi:hypothetical protein
LGASRIPGTEAIGRQSLVKAASLGSAKGNRDARDGRLKEPGSNSSLAEVKITASSASPAQPGFSDGKRPEKGDRPNNPGKESLDIKETEKVKVQ